MDNFSRYEVTSVCLLIKQYLELKYSEQVDEPAVLGVSYDPKSDSYAFFVNTKHITTLKYSQLGAGRQEKFREVLLRIVDLAKNLV